MSKCTTTTPKLTIKSNWYKQNFINCIMPHHDDWLAPWRWEEVGSSSRWMRGFWPVSIVYFVFPDLDAANGAPVWRKCLPEGFCTKYGPTDGVLAVFGQAERWIFYEFNQIITPCYSSWHFMAITNVKQTRKRGSNNDSNRKRERESQLVFKLWSPPPFPLWLVETFTSWPSVGLLVDTLAIRPTEHPFQESPNWICSPSWIMKFEWKVCLFSYKRTKYEHMRMPSIWFAIWCETLTAARLTLHQQALPARLAFQACQTPLLPPLMLQTPSPPLLRANWHPQA